MRKNSNKQIKEALGLMKSESKDVFVTDLESSIEKAIERAKGKANATVESAVALSVPEKKRTEKILFHVLGRKVEAKYVVAPSLLGGLKITVGDWILDASLSYQIEKMKNIFGGSI